MGYRYIFGPIASRRFGRSLGVDLLGRRVCSFDCIFCEAGPTQTCTLQRDVYVPTELVLAELRAWLGSGGEADVVTLAGRGEPTLHTGFGQVIDAIHAMCAIPVVLLSNGSLMWMPEVRADAARADIVKVSLSGWNDETIADINQPAAGLDFENYLAGLIAFRDTYRGELRLEVMFVHGVNDTDADAREMAGKAALIGADKIEINTVVRPPASKGLVSVPAGRLARYAAYFGDRAVVIGAPAAGIGSAVGGTAAAVAGLEERVLAMLARRGCTRAEICEGLGVLPEDVTACLDELVRRGLVELGSEDDPWVRLVVVG